MANMKAVAKDAGAAHIGFVILPLVALLCVDAINRFLIEWFLAGF